MKNQIEISFKGSTANLFDVGYILTDIYQINSVSQYLDAGEIKIVEKRYGEKTKGLNRYSAFNKEIEKNTEIVEVKKGSLILITAVTATATILAAVLGAYVKQKLEESNEHVDLFINPTDNLLNDIIANYEMGMYGRGRAGFNNLMATLGRSNYNVRSIQHNTLLIESIIDRAANRVVKTIRKSR